MTTENNNIILTETVQEKDLGVWISNNLKWEKQVVAATQQAMVVLRSVKRAFIHFDRETFNIVYNALYQTISRILHTDMVTLLCKIYFNARESVTQGNKTGNRIKGIYI